MADHQEVHWISRLMIVLASLLCGTGVWVVVQLNERSEITLDVEVVQQAGTDTRVDVNLLRNRVPVQFSFPTTETQKMRAENFVVMVDFPDVLERLSANQETISGDKVLTADMVQTRPSAGFDMEALNIVPTEILVRQAGWEARLRTLPATIDPKVTGSPRGGYVFDPDRLEVEMPQDFRVLLTKGKQEELRDKGVGIYHVATEPIDISGKSGTLREQTKLVLDDGVSLFPGEPEEVYVSITLVEEVITRVLEDVLVTYEPFSARQDLRAVLNPDKVDVLLTGPGSAVNAVTPEMIGFAFYTYVDEVGETWIVPIAARVTDADLGRQIMNVDTQPSRVEVRIEQVGGAPALPTPTPRPSILLATPTSEGILDGTNGTNRTNGAGAVTPNPSPSPSPSPSSSPSPSPTPSPSPSVTPSPIPSPSPTAVQKTPTPNPTVATSDKPTS